MSGKEGVHGNEEMRRKITEHPRMKEDGVVGAFIVFAWLEFGANCFLGGWFPHATCRYFCFLELPFLVIQRAEAWGFHLDPQIIDRTYNNQIKPWGCSSLENCLFTETEGSKMTLHCRNYFQSWAGEDLCKRTREGMKYLVR